MNPEQIRARLRELLEQRRQHEGVIAAVRTALEARCAADPTATTTADETAQIAAATAAIDQIDADVTNAEQALAGAERAERAQAHADELRGQLGGNVGGARVAREERTYRPDGSHSFLCDLYAQQILGERSASDRISRHMHEWSIERRDIAVAALAGVIPPQYLVDQFAPIARAGRPFLNSLNALPLPPEGVSFYIPRATTGSAGAMTSEAAGWNEQDIAATNDNPLVNLVTAQQDVSRTLFMRGGAVVDRILFPDLIAASEVALNTSAMNGNGSAPQHRGILQVSGISAVTYTDGTPTVGESWPKFADAIQRINSLRFAPGTAIYMHPRRWGWITAALDANGRPLFNFTMTPPPATVVALGEAAKYGQIVGTLQTLPVITDATIPTNLGAGTNEDIVVVARTTDVVYWEDDIMQFTFEQTLTTAPGQIRLAAGRFSLFHAGRYPTAISTIGGTGFVTPTF